MRCKVKVESRRISWWMPAGVRVTEVDLSPKVQVPSSLDIVNRERLIKLYGSPTSDPWQAVAAYDWLYSGAPLPFAKRVSNETQSYGNQHESR
jgi:hypothetical protein